MVSVLVLLGHHIVYIEGTLVEAVHKAAHLCLQRLATFVAEGCCVSHAGVCFTDCHGICQQQKH